MQSTNGSAAIDWDNARVFLAVARHGSLRAAGRALGLSQPTIGRRLAAFEAVFGGPALFDRLPEGLRLNAAGEALLPAAEELEDAALALERRHAAVSPALSGTVRVSVGEWAARFLAGNLDRTSATPLPSGITVELVESHETANLARREADLAVRHHPPEGGDLYIAKIGTFAAAVYRRTGADGDAWVTYTEEQAHYPTAQWVQQRLRAMGGSIALRASNMAMQLAGPGPGRGSCPALSATPTRCWNVLYLRRRRSPPIIGSSFIAICAGQPASERSSIGCRPCSSGSAKPWLVFVGSAFPHGEGGPATRDDEMRIARRLWAEARLSFL
jgi:DNA-binding transcriptional LysR family regulator